MLIYYKMENAICFLQDMCRLCLDAPGTLNIIENETCIIDIFQCTGILQVSRNDKLPEKICKTCMFRIKVSKDLREFATRNDFYMRSLVSSDIESPYDTPHVITRPTTTFKPADGTVSSSTENENRSATNENTEQSDYCLEESKKKSSITESMEEIDEDDFGLRVKKTHRPKISVRSLDDINSRKSVVISSSTPYKRQTSSFSFKMEASPIKRKTNSTSKTEASPIKRQTRSSSAKAKASSIKSRNSSSESTSTSVEKKIVNNKEHKCDICKKVYGTSKKLYHHKRSHAKNIYCPLDVCGKRFACKGDLQKHIRSHTGEKPYQCNMCDKSFAQNVSLRCHKEVTHQAKMEIM